MSICVGVAGSKAQFKRHGGGERWGERNRNGEKGTERLDIIEGNNLRRQMGKIGAQGEQMDSRNDGRRETRDTEKQGRCERLREWGCEEK